MRKKVYFLKMDKATIIDYICNQIIKPSSGTYAHSIKDWYLKIYN